MENDINWLKLDDLLDEIDYSATDEEIKQAFENRGYIEIQSNNDNES